MEDNLYFEYVTSIAEILRYWNEQVFFIYKYIDVEREQFYNELHENEKMTW